MERFAKRFEEYVSLMAQSLDTLIVSSRFVATAPG
jgi:hypothetical protein